ncbi:glycosyltransferase family 2 protein [Pistricoccus aurantiacus]|uniref:glycosyltransferase family 2 protein n=1 Tax=Pistricoccus aurantiacus TaxID=1883414 RepID=UPI003628BD55
MTALENQTFGEEYRVTGHIDVFSINKKMKAFECYESISAFNQLQNLKDGFLVTANLLVRAKLFKRVVLFDEHPFSGGDKEWTRSATALGHKIKYVPNSIVNHPARSTWPEMTQKLRRTTGGKITIFPDYKISAFRSFFPPIEAASHIIKHKNSNLRVKTLVFLVAYRIQALLIFFINKKRAIHTRAYMREHLP